MDRIARAPQEERAELFRRSAGVLRPERSPAIIEKDFWVCWTLHRLYDVLRFRPQLIFKGGTSLSITTGTSRPTDVIATGGAVVDHRPHGLGRLLNEPRHHLAMVAFSWAFFVTDRRVRIAQTAAFRD